METKRIRETRQRLTTKYEELIRSINRNRLATEQIQLENTKDEGDSATISHDRELLYHLHETDFQQLGFIREALRALDRGRYGDCGRCGEDINEKRLRAMPWVTLCIRCQEQTEFGLEEEMDL